MGSADKLVPWILLSGVVALLLGMKVARDPSPQPEAKR
jgi:hypothetical protein